MARPRDSQRKRVYDAEWRIDFSTYGGRLETVEALQHWTNKINNSRWMSGFVTKHSPGIMYRPVTVKDGRSRRRAGAHIYLRTAEIPIPKWCRSKLMILHEMAHIYTPLYVAWHGQDFCATYLDLTRRWLGKDAHTDLKNAFIESKVKFRRS